MILGIAGISTNRGGRCRSETDILSGKWNYETERRIPWSEWGKYGSGHPCEIIEYLNMCDVPCPALPPAASNKSWSHENSSNNRKTWIIVVIFSSETQSSDRRRETRHIKYIKSNQRSKQFWQLTFVTRTVWCLDCDWERRGQSCCFPSILFPRRQVLDSL